MLPTAPAVRRSPPVAAIAAAALALVSCAYPVLFLAVVVALTGPGLGGTSWVDLAVPVVVLCALVTGAVLLLLGRSWTVLVIAAGGMAVVLVAAHLLGGWGGGAFWLLSWVTPAVAAVLGALPVVRRWVADRRSARPR